MVHLLVHKIKTELRFRLLFLVIVAALFSLLVSSVILFRWQRNQMIGTGLSSAAMMGNLVEVSLHHAMLENDWNMINELVQTTAYGAVIDEVHIINLQGVVRASSNPGELGSKFEMEDQLCQECHASGSQTTEKIGAYDPMTGEQMLFSAHLIENSPACYSCHSDDQEALGLLITQSSLAVLNRNLINGLLQLLFIALLTGSILVIFLVLVLNKYFLRPVEDLSKGVNALATGNLDYEVQPRTRDELGKLAESFNQMRQRLKHTYQELENREKEAGALYLLSTKISSSLSLSGLLDSTAQAACELLRVDVSLVGLYDEESKEIIMRAAVGVRADAHKGMRMSVSPNTPGSALLEGRPVIAEAIDQNNILHPDNSLITDESIISILAIPLHYGEKFLGVIEVMSRDRREFTQANAKLLMRMGQIVVIAIENVQLYHQLRYLATLEERDRLAREMHDELAQLLGYLNVRASITHDLLADGRLAEGQESLNELRTAAKTAYTNVREEIFNLRTSVSARVGLLPTMRSYLTEYHTHYGLETKLTYEHESLTEFPSEVANQLLRIIQEALTNVRKHANATMAWIRFVQERGNVCIQVADNGQGFNPDEQPGNGHQSYGLQVMRERAELIGGTLYLESSPGKGTRISVCVPIIARN